MSDEARAKAMEAAFAQVMATWERPIPPETVAEMAQSFAEHIRADGWVMVRDVREKPAPVDDGRVTATQWLDWLREREIAAAIRAGATPT